MVAKCGWGFEGSRALLTVLGIVVMLSRFNSTLRDELLNRENACEILSWQLVHNAVTDHELCKISSQIV